MPWYRLCFTPRPPSGVLPREALEAGTELGALGPRGRGRPCMSSAGVQAPLGPSAFKERWGSLAVQGGRCQGPGYRRGSTQASQGKGPARTQGLQRDMGSPAHLRPSQSVMPPPPPGSSLTLDTLPRG